MGPLELYSYVWSLRDPRTADWGLTADAKFVFPLIALYLYVVKYAGPRFMENRKPYSLKPAILTYNVFMVVANLYFFWNFLRRSYLGGGYSLFCQGVSYGTDAKSMELLNLGWWYSIVRVLDFLDTIFFVLRKKYAHISSLHVIHHTLVVFSGWLWMTFASDGQVMLGLCFNALIHVIMYSYYALAALGPRVRPYLWWKRYLTKLQIFQFAFLLVHISITLVYDCGYPRALTLIAIAQGVLGLYLFIDFYWKTYRAQQEASQMMTAKQSSNKTPICADHQAAFNLEARKTA